MMKRKGQIGRILTTFPVMILIVMVLAIYILLSVGLKVTNGPGEFSEKTFNIEENILFENIILRSSETGYKETDISLLDALVLLNNGEIRESQIRDGLRELVNKEKRCVYLFYKGSSFGWYLNQDNVVDINDIVKKDINRKVETQIYLHNGNEFIVQSYYGSCLEAEDE